MVEQVVQETVQHADLLGSLGINGKIFVAQLINFSVVLLVLWRFVFRPINKILHERKQTIIEGMENAKKAESNMLMAEAAYQKKMDEAAARVNELVSNAQVKADQMIVEAKARAKQEVEKVVTIAREQLKDEKQRMHKEVHEEVVTLVFALAEKILGKKLDAKKDAELVKGLLK